MFFSFETLHPRALRWILRDLSLWPLTIRKPNPDQLIAVSEWMCALSLCQGVTKITCLQELDEREVTASLTSRHPHKETSWKHRETRSKTLPSQTKRGRRRVCLRMAAEKLLSWYSENLNLISMPLENLLSGSGFSKTRGVLLISGAN